MFPTHDEIATAIKAEGGKLYGDNMVVVTRTQLARYTDATLAKYGNPTTVEVERCPRSCKKYARQATEVVEKLRLYAESISEN